MFVKKIIVVLVVLALAMYAGIFIARDPGYLLLSYQTTTIEMPLWLAFFLLLMLWLFSFFVVNLLRATYLLPSRVRHFFAKRHRQHQWRAIQHFVAQLIAKDWRHITLSLPGEDPVLPLLLRARLACEQNAWQDAQTILVPLFEQYPKHVAVLTMLAEVYQHQAQWRAWLDLLPRLKRAKLIEENALTQCFVMAYSGMLEVSVRDLQQLTTQWLQIPRALRKNTKLIRSYVMQLLQYQAYDAAEAILCEAIKRQYDTTLVALYGLAQSTKLEQQLKNTQRWLKNHPNDAVLLETLGRLCLYQQLWGNAKCYLEQSLKIKPRKTVYQLLIRLLERLNQTQQVAQYYKEAFLMIDKDNGYG